MTASTTTTTTTTGAGTLRGLAARLGLRIGTAVNATQLAGDPSYAALTAEQFSTVTAENVMKWNALEPVRGRYDWAAADQLIAFAEANDQLVRGHTLVWHNQLPEWLEAAAPTMTTEELREALRTHIVDVATRFAGRVWQWDVVNEAVDDDGTPRDSVWLQRLGPGYIADAFRWAHEADPDALLFYNDYSIEHTGPKSRAVYELVSTLRAEGVPIHGVGLQTHLATQHGFPDLQETMQRFVDLGLAVALTEVDVRSPLPVTPAVQATQADFYARTLKACLAVEGCLSYTVWGVSDAHSWVPSTFPGEGDADIYDADLNPKPQYTALRTVLESAVSAQSSPRGE